jgi:phospholipase/lecithinase/hemolysin
MVPRGSKKPVSGDLMKHFRSWAVAVLGAVLLAACGGDDPYVPGQGQPSGAPTTKGTFTALVTFGDSLSDVGTYTAATSIAGDGSAPYLGGKWTTNTTPQTATIWVENLAQSLGIIVTPAEVGWGTQSLACPIKLTNPALAGTCTAYGQGGSLVTDPIGINHAAGPLTVPVKTQIQRHLQAFGSFRDSDLIVVWGGANEVFAHFETFAADATGILTKAALGQITQDQAKGLLLEAQLAALGKMKTAALEMSDYVKNDILAKGGRYVAVVNVPDFADIPFGAALAADPRSAGLVPVLTALSENFNFWLREGLTNQPVLAIDGWTLFKQIKANPGNYGLLNITTPTCDFKKQDVILGTVLTSGRALFCNVTTGASFDMSTTGSDPTTWLFADDAHPTIGGHRVLAQEFAKQMRALGWIN